MILGVALETCRRGAGEYLAVAFLAEQAAGHRGAWGHAGRLQDPTPCPAWFQALLGYGEIRGGGPGVVLRVARHVTLQAWGAFAREQISGHCAFLVS